jgi:hypothetical protein
MGRWWGAYVGNETVHGRDKRCEREGFGRRNREKASGVGEGFEIDKRNRFMRE